LPYEESTTASIPFVSSGGRVKRSQPGGASRRTRLYRTSTVLVAPLFPMSIIDIRTIFTWTLILFQLHKAWSFCKDLRPKRRACAAKLAAGLCPNVWGCNATCGLCSREGQTSTNVGTARMDVSVVSSGFCARVPVREGNC